TSATDTSRRWMRRLSSLAARSASSVTVQLRLPGIAEKRDGPAERRFAAAELPREAAENQPLVLERLRGNLAAKILDVHAVLREERVVRELIRGVRKELRDAGGPAELLLTLFAHAIAMAVHALPQKPADGQIHGMVGGNAIDAP